MPEESSELKTFTCPICGTEFYSQRGLEWHKETDHDEATSPPRRMRL